MANVVDIVELASQSLTLGWNWILYHLEIKALPPKKAISSQKSSRSLFKLPIFVRSIIYPIITTYTYKKMN